MAITMNNGVLSQGGNVVIVNINSLRYIKWASNYFETGSSNGHMYQSGNTLFFSLGGIIITNSTSIYTYFIIFGI